MGYSCTGVLKKKPRRKELDSHKIINWETGPWQYLMHLCHHFRDGKQMFRQTMCIESHRLQSCSIWTRNGARKEQKLVGCWPIQNEWCLLLAVPQWPLATQKGGCPRGRTEWWLPMLPCSGLAAQSLSRVRLFVAPWTAACQASLSFTISWSLLKTHVHWSSEAIQSSHPLSSPSPSAFSFSQHQGFF